MRKLKIQRCLPDKSGRNNDTILAPKKRQTKMTLLSAITNIIDLAEDSELREDFFVSAEKYTKYLSKREGISVVQAVLLSLLIEECFSGGYAKISDLSRFLSCRTTRVLEYHAELENLVDKGFLYQGKRNHDSNSVYYIPERVIDALNNNKPFKKISYSGSNGFQFFQHFYDLTHLRYDDQLSTKLLLVETQRLLVENKDCHYVKILKSFNLKEESELILTHFARHLVLQGLDGIKIKYMTDLFDNSHDVINFVRSIENETNELIKRNLIEPVFDDGFKSNEEYRLTDEIRPLLLEGFDYKITVSDSHTNIIKCENIISKDLYFENHVQRQLNEIAELLNENNYQSICRRLKERGHRTGVACLFHGAPGTGKTESVMQLAKLSGRDIVQVNISEIKNKWVGESEKNIKEIFDSYRSVVKRSSKKPILLFNEADAIIGKRKEGAVGSIDKMENSIQNIILQEMETLNGIMIATTNLVQNLDKAFERRFLYKIKFERPTKEQRRFIWKSMMPKLDDNIIQKLAHCYDFSGGQIENISRKCDIEFILHGTETISENYLEKICKEETIDHKINTKIGYV